MTCKKFREEMPDVDRSKYLEEPEEKPVLQSFNVDSVRQSVVSQQKIEPEHPIHKDIYDNYQTCKLLQKQIDELKKLTKRNVDEVCKFFNENNNEIKKIKKAMIHNASEWCNTENIIESMQSRIEGLNSYIGLFYDLKLRVEKIEKYLVDRGNVK